MDKEKAFHTNGNRGFHMHFGSGLTVSVIWAWGNYCENWAAEHDIYAPHDWDSNDAEVAVWHQDHPDVKDWIDVSYFLPDADGEGHGGVCGWLTSEQVAELLYKASKEDETFWNKYTKFYTDKYEKELKFHDQIS